MDFRFQIRGGPHNSWWQILYLNFSGFWKDLNPILTMEEMTMKYLERYCTWVCAVLLLLNLSMPAAGVPVISTRI